MSPPLGHVVPSVPPCQDRATFLPLLISSINSPASCLLQATPPRQTLSHTMLYKTAPCHCLQFGTRHPPSLILKPVQLRSTSHLLSVGLPLKPWVCQFPIPMSPQLDWTRARGNQRTRRRWRAAVPVRLNHWRSTVCSGREGSCSARGLLERYGRDYWTQPN